MAIAGEVIAALSVRHGRDVVGLHAFALQITLSLEVLEAVLLCGRDLPIRDFQSETWRKFGFWTCGVRITAGDLLLIDTTHHRNLNADAHEIGDIDR